ncbi:MAG: hypothetical protein Q4B63_05895 [Clostridium perfringens]|nr:hypothetical protein [Clostridium perfringens]
MTLKSKGYLLVDLSIALTIFSILSLGIFTFYKTYKKIDTENKRKIEYLNCINYISMNLKYNLTFDEVLELILDKEYTFDMKNELSIDELNSSDKWLSGNIYEVNKIIKNNNKLNGYYISLSSAYESDKTESINKDILSIKIKFMKNSEQCLYENIITKYRYIL